MRTFLRCTGLIVAIVLCAILAGDHVVAQSGESGHDVSLESAMRAINASLKKSQELDTKMNIAILDVGGNLKAFVRMDGAFLGSADIAMRKAKTARLFNMPSDALGSMSQPGGPLFGIESSNGGLITFAGGLPLTNSEGDVIGSIGVSG